MVQRKLPPDREVFRLASEGLTQTEIAARFGTTQTVVGDALRKCPEWPALKARLDAGRKKRPLLWHGKALARLVKTYQRLGSLGRTAAALGTSRSTVRRNLRYAGVPVRTQSEAQKGENNPAWAGGVTRLGRYHYLLRPDHPAATLAGYVAEHRLVVEKMLGRYLHRSEVVHHVDGNPLNNRPENLQVFRSNGEHLAFELAGRCPKWSEAGRARLLQAARGPRKSSRTPPPSKPGGPR